MSRASAVKVLMDIRILQGEDARRGIGNYTRGLARALLNLSSGGAPRPLAVHFLAADGMPEPDIDLAGAAGVIRIPAERRPQGWLRRPADALALCRSAESLGADILHVSSPLHGPFEWLPVRRVATVAVVYDLIPWLESETYLELWPLVARQRYLARMNRLRRVDGILAISEAVAHDVRVVLGVRDCRLCVAAPGVGPAFDSFAVHESESADPYVVAFASGNPSKNLWGFLEAWRGLAPRLSESGNAARLVLIGPDDGVFRDRVREVLAPVSGETVDYVAAPSDERLAEIIAGARCLVAPSLAEGFGLPALEAAAVGTPVVASDIVVLREVLGEAGVYFDPREPGSIAEAVSRVLADAETRERMRRRGLERAARFSWGDTALAVAAAYCRWAA